MHKKLERILGIKRMVERMQKTLKEKKDVSQRS